MLAFIIVWSSWFLSEIVLNRKFRVAKNENKSYDKGSKRIIWITIGAANSLGIALSIFFKISISNLSSIPYLGLVLILSGMALRFFAIKSLGKLFTVGVTIRENHRIKQDGIYGIVRHPAYLGSLLSFIGFGISLNNWLSLMIISVLVSSVFLYRIKIEETVLIRQFGEEYTNYMHKTSRLVPWIY